MRRDDGSYVYASLDDDGQLIPTTLVAHDAGERTKEERSYVERVGRLKPQLTEKMAQMRKRNQTSRARDLL